MNFNIKNNIIQKTHLIIAMLYFNLTSNNNLKLTN